MKKLYEMKEIIIQSYTIVYIKYPLSYELIRLRKREKYRLWHESAHDDQTPKRTSKKYMYECLWVKYTSISTVELALSQNLEGIQFFFSSTASG